MCIHVVNFTFKVLRLASIDQKTRADRELSVYFNFSTDEEVSEYAY